MAFDSILTQLRTFLTAVSVGGPSHFTAREVRCLLHPATAAAADDRQQAVLATAAQPGAWMDRLGKRDAWELGRLGERLPSLISLYSSGASLDEIRARLGTWSTWEIGHAIDVACGCIAGRLNDRALPAVRGASKGTSGRLN